MNIHRRTHPRTPCRRVALLPAILLLLAASAACGIRADDGEGRRPASSATDRTAARPAEPTPPPSPSNPIPYGDLERLEEALRQYEQTAPRRGTRVPEGSLLQEGDSGEGVTALRRRLAELGHLPSQLAAGDGYDQQVVAAVESFQGRYGIEVDGIAGPSTLHELNRSPEDRVRQGRESLEAMRQFGARAEPRYVLVNVPDFYLFWVADGEVADAMKVIVGKEGWNTPTMHEEIQQIVVHPDWNAPASIIAADIAPKVAEDPGYLAANDMVVLSSWEEDADEVDPATIDWADVTAETWKYRLRQLPGPENPLGEMKFLFPNEEDIYLHGTPAQHLFDKDVRALSHGCIRVERPRDLANHLLAGHTSVRETFDSALAAGEQQWIELPRKVPVHLVYWHAFLGEDGELQFRPDPWSEPPTKEERAEPGDEPR
ncbi:MAG TPA: L,D-transpeptidase family protein [Thermoanaerobaculia bacterium]|nr:L,D-transpeptidase family protein [Thermoanaerobaculia bacterium]